MNAYLTITPFVGVIAYLALRNRSSVETSINQRPDFIQQASESRFVAHEPAFTIVSNLVDYGEYNYEVVGESYQRDHLTSLIRAHKAFDTGEIFSTAVLELEPTNPFDPNAVKVVVEGTQVGYIPKLDSSDVTAMIKKSGKSVFEVPVRIGWDTNSPSPLIGVRLALVVNR
jgi:HIRAN domain